MAFFIYRVVCKCWFIHNVDPILSPLGSSCYGIGCNRSLSHTLSVNVQILHYLHVSRPPVCSLLHLFNHFTFYTAALSLHPHATSQACSWYSALRGLLLTSEVLLNIGNNTRCYNQEEKLCFGTDMKYSTVFYVFSLGCQMKRQQVWWTLNFLCTTTPSWT